MSKEYKVTFLRKKIQYEACEMILKAGDRESVNNEAEYWLDLCSCDGSSPPEMEWEEEEAPIDLSQLTPISKDCPHCSSSISVEPSFDDKVSLECTKCGAKGRIPNPYADEIERLRGERETESILEFDDD